MAVRKPVAAPPHLSDGRGPRFGREGSHLRAAAPTALWDWQQRYALFFALLVGYVYSRHFCVHSMHRAMVLNWTISYSLNDPCQICRWSFRLGAKDKVRPLVFLLPNDILRQRCYVSEPQTWCDCQGKYCMWVYCSLWVFSPHQFLHRILRRVLFRDPTGCVKSSTFHFWVSCFTPFGLLLTQQI